MPRQRRIAAAMIVLEREIDKAYNLYGLTQEQIKIVGRGSW
jgi:hypothetical protein